MEIRQDRRCFVCGPDNPVGLRAVFTPEGEGRASCTLALPATCQGWKEMTHGGIITALLDEAAIYACRSGDDRLVTAELNVRFRKPVPVGRTITVVGEVTEKRRRVNRVRSRLILDGEVHAEAEVRVVQI